MTDVTKNKNYIVNELKDDYLYVKKRLDTLTPELLPIYYLCEVFYESLEDLDINKLDIIADEHPYIKGLLYPLISTKYYINEMYDKSLIYAIKAKEVYEREYNFNRLLVINSNITNLYLLMKNYHLALDNIEKVVPLYYSFNQGEPMFVNFKLVFYSSLYFNKKIDEILYSINRSNKLHTVDFLFKAICSIKKGKYDELKLIKEECALLYKDSRYIAIELMYDYFFLKNCNLKKYITNCVDYRKYSYFISDILLNLIK